MPQLTQMELKMLDEQLSAEQLAITKCNIYAAQSTDPAVQQLCQTMAQRHQQHYNALAQHLSATSLQ